MATKLKRLILPERLEVLERRGLIRVTQLEPELEYLFRHALTRDAVYASVLRQDRRELHRAVGAAMEKLYPKQRETLAAEMALHFAGAGDDARALEYYTLAGDAALKVYANAEAERHYRAALALARTDSERAHLLGQIGEALHYQSRYAESVEVRKEAVALYHALGDTDSAARVYSRSARALSFAGNWPGALALCRDGLAALADGVETAGLAALLHETGRACYFNGLADEAGPLCRRALALAEKLKVVDVQADTLATLSILPGQSPEESIAALRRAVELAETAGLLGIASRAHNNLAYVLALQGKLRAGRDANRQAAEIARRRGEVAGEFSHLDGALESSLALGEPAEAERILAYMRERLRAVGSAPDQGHIDSCQMVLDIYYGEWTAALEGIAQMQAREQASGKPQGLAAAANWLGTYHYLREEWEESTRAMQEAVILGDRSGSRGEERYVLAPGYAWQGRPTEARRVLAEAGERLKGAPLSPSDAADRSRAEAVLAGVEGRRQEAENAFRATLEGYSRMENRWYRAHTLRDWAEVCLRWGGTDDISRARELLIEALSEYEAMGCPGHAEFTRQKLAKISL